MAEKTERTESERTARQILEALRKRQRAAASRRRARARAAGFKQVSVWVHESYVHAAKAEKLVPVAVIYGPPGTTMPSYRVDSDAKRFTALEPVSDASI